MNVIAAAAGSGGSPALGFVLIILGVIAYWIPTAIAWFRHVPNAGSVTVINTFLGWTVIGWIVALAMACRSRPSPATVPSAAVAPTREPGRGV